MDRILQKKLNTGLTDEEVREKTQQGLINGEIESKTKSYSAIIRDNLFTLFNLINVILLVCILISGSLKNALFFLVVIWNMLIGSVQEIRAKKTIEKLSLLSAPKAYALREGTVQEIPVSEIVLGEIMQLKAGYQICADAAVLKGSCQVNESLITGESTPVFKKEGDHLLSGSFLISGQVLAEAEHVGADNYVHKMTAGAKYFKKPDSVIMQSVKSIVKVIAIAIIPLAALLVWNNFFRTGLDFSVAMVKTVAAVSSMIPGGLVLLVSIVLAVSVVRLSLHNTLVQDLYCVENLARVDTLLLDKTGTITEGNLEMESLVQLPDPGCSDEPVHESDSAELLQLLQFYMDHIVDENTTAGAVRRFLENTLSTEQTEITSSEEITSLGQEGSSGRRFSGMLHIFQSCSDDSLFMVPFSSDRKWSLIASPEAGTLVFGAPEYIMGDAFDSIREQISGYTGQMKRVILFAVSPELPARKDENDVILPAPLIPAALLILSDRIRESAPETFRFFEEEGVQIKVISGDSPVTVSMVAQQAGLTNAQQWTDASVFRNEEELKAAADQYTVFGRVTPSQKLAIVKSLQEQGHVVAMTGDGANDVLALKQADCSIAMQNGSDAARNVANLVLLDSDFSSLPYVVAEGRKSINNLQRSAALYLTKTTYAFVFAILFIFASTITYPFENIQVTLIGAITIGIPSFFLALEPNNQRIRSHFLRNVFITAIPTGLLEAAAIILTLFLLKYRFSADDAQISTAAACLLLMCGIITVFNIAGKLNLWKCLLVAVLIAAAAGAVLILPGLFSFVPVTSEILKLILLIAAGFFIIHTGIYRFIMPALIRKKES